MPKFPLVAEHDNVEFTEDPSVTLEGLKEHVRPACDEYDRLTVPVKPPRLAIVTVNVPVAPGAAVWLPGVTVSEKPFTTIVIVTVLNRLPDFAVTVTM